MANLIFDAETDDELEAAIQYLEKICDIEKTKVATTKEALDKMKNLNNDLNAEYEDSISGLCHYYTKSTDENCNYEKLVIEPIYQIMDEIFQQIYNNPTSTNEPQILLDTKILIWKEKFENNEILDFKAISIIVDELKNTVKEYDAKIQNRQKTINYQKDDFKQKMDILQNSIQQLRKFKNEQQKYLINKNESLQSKTQEIEIRSKDINMNIESLKSQISDLEEELIRFEINNMEKKK